MCDSIYQDSETISHMTVLCRDLDGRQMALGGFLDILNDQLTEIKSGESDGQAAAAEGVAFEILGK